MDIKWLEDFLRLADTRNFSKAAVERHVTQPAFSRRIRALEAWVGTDLVDRSIYPTALTPAGKLFRDQAADTLRQLNDVRGLLRGKQRGTPDMLTVAAGHTLAITFFAKWIAGLQKHIGSLSTRLVATNVHDAVLALVESGCDLLLCYSSPAFPIQLDQARYASVLLGHDALIPVSIPGPTGAPLHEIRGRKGRSLPVVTYSSTSYLGRATDLVLHELNRTNTIVFQCITDRSETVRAMVLEGLGMGWLPESMIARDFAEGRLVRAGGDKLCVELQIRIFRSLENRKSTVERVWDYLSHADLRVYDSLKSGIKLGKPKRLTAKSRARAPQ